MAKTCLRFNFNSLLKIRNKTVLNQQFNFFLKAIFGWFYYDEMKWSFQKSSAFYSRLPITFRGVLVKWLRLRDSIERSVVRGPLRDCCSRKRQHCPAEKKTPKTACSS